MQLGSHHVKNRLILAPMAGVTDYPFRTLCRRLGAGLTPSEMVSANPALRQTRKSQTRLTHMNESSPRIVQIAGGDPHMLAEAARYNVALGAEIIDINMGCPAKKVCNKAAGSALLKDERLVSEILSAVVNAVDVPVTLKTRTGWSSQRKNSIRIAAIAEQAGISALAIHGRTREDRFSGSAEFDTIAEIKSRVSIPIIANGDIDSPKKAQAILKYTNADALMIGRAAQGNPWIFREINHYLKTGHLLPPATATEVFTTLKEHLQGLNTLYGDYLGPRVARKHVGWYLKAQGHHYQDFLREFNRVEEMKRQIKALELMLLHDYNIL